MSPEEAVAAGRLHHQWLPDRIRIEREAVAPETLDELESMGHTVSMVERRGTDGPVALQGTLASIDSFST